jgi:hypothetical protein
VVLYKNNELHYIDANMKVLHTFLTYTISKLNNFEDHQEKAEDPIKQQRNTAVSKF